MTVKVRVEDVNQTPQGPAFTGHHTAVGRLMTFSLLGSDGDSGDTLTYSASQLPLGATLDVHTGEFRWTPAPGQEGDYLATFQVSDGKDTIQYSAAASAHSDPAPLLTLDLTPSFPVLPGQKGRRSRRGTKPFRDLTARARARRCFPSNLTAKGWWQITPSSPGAAARQSPMPMATVRKCPPPSSSSNLETFFGPSSRSIPR